MIDIPIFSRVALSMTYSSAHKISMMQRVLLLSIVVQKIPFLFSKMTTLSAHIWQSSNCLFFELIQTNLESSELHEQVTWLKVSVSLIIIDYPSVRLFHYECLTFWLEIQKSITWQYAIVDPVWVWARFSWIKVI